MPIQDLRVTNVGPFEEVAFTFDEHINVFVGANSSGKSTTLMTLANLAVYPFALPGRLRRSAPATYAVRFVGRHGQVIEQQGSLPIDQDAPGQQARMVSTLEALGYSVFVPALRYSTGTRAAGPAPRQTSPATRQLPEELLLRRLLLPTDATLIRDEAVVSRMVEFATRGTQRNDPAMHQLLAQITTIASEILAGFPVEFWRLAEDRDGFYPQFRTLDGNIGFDVFSQGTQSVLQWLAYVLISYAKYYGYPSNLADQPGLMIIDEIDAHLHPTAQQRILPVLRKHFPRLQLFCSTHSPLMLPNLAPGQLHLLQRSPSGTVTVSRNTGSIVGQSTDTLLHQYFGISPAPASAAQS